LLFGLCLRDQKKIDALEEMTQQKIILGAFKNWQAAHTEEIMRYFTDHYAHNECMAGNIRYFCEVLGVENRLRHEMN
jgi:hypothetical protein